MRSVDRPETRSDILPLQVLISSDVVTTDFVCLDTLLTELQVAVLASLDNRGVLLIAKITHRGMDGRGTKSGVDLWSRIFW